METPRTTIQGYVANTMSRAVYVRDESATKYLLLFCTNKFLYLYVLCRREHEVDIQKNNGSAPSFYVV